jgi:glucose/mannose-6-phosphate isomerase
MSLDELRSHDPDDMYSAIRNFPAQMREGIEIGKHAPVVSRSKARRVLITGLGGSAIGGDLFRSYINAFPDHGGIDVMVYRGYQPPMTDAKTVLVASSYSGNTEETLTAYKAAEKSAGQVVVVTTGGKILKLAEKNRHKTVLLPGGLQPRAALGYSFFPLLYMLAVKSELFGEEVRQATEEGLQETSLLLDDLSQICSTGPKRTNPAYAIAQKIQGKIPVIYSAADRFDTVNLRWRGQIQENAKHLAFGNLLPEMNHNEINGWLSPKEMIGNFIAIFLRDRDDHERVQARIGITKKIVGRKAGATHEIMSQGDSLLARMFSLIHLGDWVSYYLAVLNGVDPMPVPVIENLKKELEKM